MLFSAFGLTVNNTTQKMGIVPGYFFSKTDFSISGMNVSLGPKDRVIEVLGASLTGNSTNGFTAAADVTFNNLTLTAPQFANSTIQYGNFQFELPAGFGTGGNTTPTAHFDYICSNATTGTIIGGLRLSTTIASLPGATAKEATATWSANNERCVSSETSVITIAGSPAAGTHCYGQFYVKNTGTIDADPYLLVIVMTFKGN
jgi:hypothetical protein